MNKTAREAALRYAEKMQEFGERMIEIAGNLEQQVEAADNLMIEINQEPEPEPFEIEEVKNEKS